MFVVELFAEVGDVDVSFPFFVIVRLHFLDRFGVQLAPFGVKVVEIILDLEATISDNWLLELAVILFIYCCSKVCTQAVLYAAQREPILALPLSFGGFLVRLVVGCGCCNGWIESCGCRFWDVI